MVKSKSVAPISLPMSYQSSNLKGKKSNFPALVHYFDLYLMSSHNFLKAKKNTNTNKAFTSILKKHTTKMVMK